MSLTSRVKLNISPPLNLYWLTIVFFTAANASAFDCQCLKYFSRSGTPSHIYLHINIAYLRRRVTGSFRMVHSRASKSNYSNHHRTHQRAHYRARGFLSKGHVFNECLKDQTRTGYSLWKTMTIRNARKARRSIRPQESGQWCSWLHCALWWSSMGSIGLAPEIIFRTGASL